MGHPECVFDVGFLLLLGLGVKNGGLSWATFSVRLFAFTLQILPCSWPHRPDTLKHQSIQSAFPAKAACRTISRAHVKAGTSGFGPPHPVPPLPNSRRGLKWTMPRPAHVAPFLPSHFPPLCRGSLVRRLG